jgi:hypothetical protein
VDFSSEPFNPPVPAIDVVVDKAAPQLQQEFR